MLLSTLDRHTPLLPHEIMAEILSWLPVKPLLQFKCVSKSWNSLISDPTFANLHLHRSPKNAEIILILKRAMRTSIVPCNITSFIQDPSSTVPAVDGKGRFSLRSNYRVIDSCNGLVCLYGCLVGEHNQHEGTRFRIWNPATRFTLENFPTLGDKYCRLEFGFGYDESSDTYKVVAIVCGSIDNDTEEEDDSPELPVVRVCSLGDANWRNIQHFPAYPALVSNVGKFVGGTLNWLAIRNESDVYYWETVTIDQLVIVSLDVANETYKQYLLPDGIDKVPHHQPQLGVFRGCLSLFHDYEYTHFVMWQMEEFGVENTWSQVFRVSYEFFPIEIDEFPGGIFGAVVPLCISEDGDILMFGIDDRSEVFLYDKSDNRVEVTGIGIYGSWIEAINYVQSLIMPC